MAFAEVFLRLGSALVAWMVVYAYYLWTAILRQAGCVADSDEMYRLVLGMAPLAVAFSFLLRVTRPMQEVHSALRWLSVPFLLLVPIALLSVWSVFSRVNIGGQSICGDGASSLWQLWWAPLQIVAVVLTSWLLLRVWRRMSS
jgi:hypothetical protein